MMSGKDDSWTVQGNEAKDGKALRKGRPTAISAIHLQGDEVEEDENNLGNLVMLSKTTKNFLEVTFSITIASMHHKKQLNWIGTPECVDAPSWTQWCTEWCH